MDVFFHVHEHKTAGHFGVNATVARARDRFYWPGMEDDIRKCVVACEVCLAKKTDSGLKQGTHQPRRSGYPMQRVYIDLVGPLSPSPQNNRYLLTIEDSYSRWVAAYPIHNKEATTVARMLVDKYICQWGCPVSIHSDQGKEFTAEVFLETMKTLGIQKTTTPPYNPQSNPVERFHRTLHAMMRTMMEREDANWEQYLPTAVFAYNSKVHSSTGFSPYYILMGREPRMPVDLLVRLPDEDELPVQDFVKDMRRRFLVMADFIKAQGDAQFHRNSHAYEGDREAWQPGTLVWFFLPRVVQGKPKKWTTQWVGPWTIVERIAPVLVKIKPANTEGAERVVHVSRLRVYRKGDGRVRTLPQNLHVDDDDDDEPDTVGTARVAIPIHMEIPVQLPVPEVEMRDLDRTPAPDPVVEAGIGRPLTQGQDVEVEDAFAPTVPSGGEEMEEAAALPLPPSPTPTEARQLPPEAMDGSQGDVSSRRSSPAAPSPCPAPLPLPVESA